MNLKNICHAKTPHSVHIVYTDALINKIIDYKKKFYTNAQIAKHIGVKVPALKRQLCRLRNNPKWRGLIPFIRPELPDIVDNPKKVGILDIEFSSNNFKADRGFILTYAILDLDSDKIYKNYIKISEIRDGMYDKRLVKDLLKDLKNFDEVIEYYGTKCDLPFIRTRAIINKLPFFNFGTIQHYDLYYLAKTKLSLHRNTLESVCAMLGVRGKNHFDFSVWQNAICCKDSIANNCIKMILDHNVRDVKITKKAYLKLIDYAKGVRKSI